MESIFFFLSFLMDGIPDLFLPFKVPLDGSFDSVVAEENRFPPSMLVNSARNLGMVIDLTKTDRYYRKQEFEDKGIKYVKLPCEGHGEVPPPHIVKEFERIVEKFSNENPDKLVGVHCTHGFNRTGFLICSYLVNIVGWDIDPAVHEFAEKRSPGIYKQHYIEELFDKFDGDKSLITVPVLPDWDAEDEDDGGYKRKHQDVADDSPSEGKAPKSTLRPLAPSHLSLLSPLPLPLLPSSSPLPSWRLSFKAATDF